MFLQGSCDAMIMAWNLIDAINKGDDVISEVYDPTIIIDGVEIPRMLFVDDILEILKTFDELLISITKDETTEKTNRTEYKPSKCKVMFMNCVPTDEIKMNGVLLDVVKDHEYLGSVISDKGRKKDLGKRIKDCKGVSNEIVEVCKTGGVSELRCTFMRLLIDACFKSKFKHGCESWDMFTNKDVQTINCQIPGMCKRIMELPGSTPTDAILHDLGLVDLDLEIEMERIILASKVTKLDDGRISKRLFESLYDKKIPGFCEALENALKKLEIDSLVNVQQTTDERKWLKSRIIEIQKKRLMKRMLTSTKTDNLILNFNYDGTVKQYLLELPFQEARVILMLRSRMLPTKANFPGRWSRSNLCKLCRQLETDEHLFICPGYRDLHYGTWKHSMFFSPDIAIPSLSEGAKVLLLIVERLLELNEDDDVVVENYIDNN